MQARPPGFLAVVGFDPVLGEARGAGRHQRRVEAARQQHAVGHVGHQLAMHRGFERRAQLRRLDLDAAGGLVVAPLARPVAHRHADPAVQVVAGRKHLDVVADADQRLHFRSHVQAARGIVAHVERADADRIAGDQVALRILVPEREGEDAVELVEEVDAVFAIQGVDHLAVRVGLELVGLAQALLQLAMVVDLAVHRQRQAAVGRSQRLRAGRHVDDGEALVHQDGPVIGIDAAPVRPAMALPHALRQGLLAQRGQVDAGRNIEDSEDRTHGVFLF